jgi:hypothetical protein
LSLLRGPWRRRRDSNPRDPFEPNGFQDRRFQPLTHSSASKYSLQQRSAGRFSSLSICNYRHYPPKIKPKYGRTIDCIIGAVPKWCLRVARVIPFLPLRALALGLAVLSFVPADVLRAQHINPPQILPENTLPSIVGQFNVRVQGDTGAPFLGPTTVTLRSQDMQVDLTTSTNNGGQATFGNIPSGQYLLEVSSGGYSTVREQVAINLSGQAQDIVVAMIPQSGFGSPRSSASAIMPRNAIKETEKGCARCKSVSSTKHKRI